jgi:hypothetical protein
MRRGERVQFLRGARRDFVAAARDMGMTEQRAQALATRLLGIPKRVRTDVSERGAKETERKAIDVGEALRGIPDSTVPRISERGAADTRRKAIDVGEALHGIPDQTTPGITARDNASGTINSVRGNLRDLDGDTATTTVTTIHRQVQEWITRGRPQPGANSVLQTEADGGVVDYFAGGSEHHVAQIAPAGAWRVWAEPETGGEAYIPLAESKRDRSKSIWREVGDRLGVRFQEMADGAILSMADGGGFVGGPRPITAPWLESRISIPEPLPSLREYNAALRERALAIRALRREQRELQQAQARARRHDTPANQRALARAERELEKALDRRREAQDRVTEAAREYGDLQRQHIEAAKQSAQTLAGRGDIFGGPFATVTSAQAQVDRAIADVTAYGRAVSRLKAAGASPFILEQIRRQAETGDIRAAVRLAEAFLANPDALARLNQAAQRLQRVSRAAGAVTNDPRFLSSQRWNPGTHPAMSSRTVNVAVGVDPTDAMREIVRVVRHEVRAELARGAT